MCLWNAHKYKTALVISIVTEDFLTFPNLEGVIEKNQVRIVGAVWELTVHIFMKTFIITCSRRVMREQQSFVPAMLIG